MALTFVAAYSWNTKSWTVRRNAYGLSMLPPPCHPPTHQKKKKTTFGDPLKFELFDQYIHFLCWTCLLLIHGMLFQSYCRRYLARLHYSKIRKSAITTQCAWRGRIARKELRKLKMVSFVLDNFFFFSISSLFLVSFKSFRSLSKSAKEIVKAL